MDRQGREKHDPRGSRALEDLLEECVRGEVAPCASAWIWHDGRVVAEAAAGMQMAPGGEQAGTSTVFDVASLTKPFAAALVHRLVAAGGLSLEARLPFSPGATLEDALAHRAGFQAWLPLYERIPGHLMGTPEARLMAIAAASSEGPIREPRASTEYSDLGYIALLPMVEEAAHARLDRAVAAHVTGPLGLGSTAFRPAGVGHHALSAIAATEDVPRRGGVIRGEVHDDNAHAMGGVSPHAGVFSTAADVGLLCAAFLESSLGRSDFLPAEVAVRAITRVAPGSRTPGWDSKSDEGSSAGVRMSSRTFGHLGYTGCSAWVDPDDLVIVILLTNRVHPTSRNEAIREWRPRFHDEAFGIALS